MCSCVIKYTKNLSPLGTDQPQVVLCTRLTGREWEPTCKSERCTGMTFTPKPCSHCARSPMQRARKYYAFFKGGTVGQKKKRTQLSYKSAIKSVFESSSFSPRFIFLTSHSMLFLNHRWAFFRSKERKVRPEKGRNNSPSETNGSILRRTTRS